MSSPSAPQARSLIAEAELLVAQGHRLAGLVENARTAVVDAHARLVAPREPTTVQVDLREPTAEQQPLVEALDRWHNIAAAARGLIPFLDRVVPSLEADLPELELLTSPVRWVLAGAARREPVLAAWQRVSEVMEWALDRGVSAQIDAIADAAPTPTDADTRHRTIMDVVGVNLGHAAATGDTAAVDAITLDTTWLRTPLRAYQRFGVASALHHERLLLADAPGIGATVQALALLAHLGPGHHLIVSAPGQRTAWARAAAEHTRLPVFRLDDPDAHAAWLASGGIGIATHDDAPTDPLALGGLIVDDAHYLRERSGRRMQTVANLSRLSTHGLLLTTDPTLTVDGPRLRRTAADLPYELPATVATVTWLDPTDDDLLAHGTAVQAGNFSQLRRAGFAATDPTASAKLARVIEMANAARRNGLKLLVTSHFHRVVATCQHTLGALGFATLGPLTDSTPAEEAAAALAEFASGAEPVVLVVQAHDDEVPLPASAASAVDLALVAEPPLGQVRVPGRVVYTLALAGTVDERILHLAGRPDRPSPASIGRQLIAEFRRDA